MSEHEEDGEENGITLQHHDVAYLSSALFSLLEMGSLCDVLIRCDGEEKDSSNAQFAHACVLAACSPVLREQITQQKLNASSDPQFTEIASQNIRHQIWSYIIRFMYTAHVFIPSSQQHLLQELSEAANQLQFRELYDVAAEYQTVLQLIGNEDTVDHSNIKTEQVNQTEEETIEEYSQQDEEATNPNNDMDTATEDSENDPLQCGVCSYKARSQRALGLHVKKHKDDNCSLQCDTCILGFDNDKELQAHIAEKHAQPTFQCKKCDFVAENTKKLSVHNRTHRELESCPVKGCSFEADKSALTRHLKHLHEEIERPFKCSAEGCEYAAENKRLITLHQERHTEGKPFMCSDCGQAFKRQKELIRHQQQKHESAKFYCSECERTFARKVYLEDHLRREHKLGQLVCPVQNCTVSFSTYDQLYRHKRVLHDKRAIERTRRHACKQCGRKFFSVSHLKVHEDAHENKRPFVCELCSKGYLQASDLKKHMMIHEGVKPFLCSVCPYATNRSSNLKNHEKRHINAKKTMLRGGGDCDMCTYHYKNAKDFSKHKKEVHNVKTFYREMIVQNRKGIKQEPMNESNDNVSHKSNISALTPTKLNILEKCKIVTAPQPTMKPSSQKTPSSVAIERCVPKSAIIAELSYSRDYNTNYPMYTTVNSRQPQKHTQIVTTTLASSGKIQTVLTSTGEHFPISILAQQQHNTEQLQVEQAEYMIMQDDNQEDEQNLLVGGMPVEIIQDVTLEGEELNDSYAQGFYNVNLHNTDVATMEEEGEDYIVLEASQPDI